MNWAWISNFVREAAYLWAVTILVVIIASCVHFVLAYGERNDLEKRIRKQESAEQPKLPKPEY